MARYCFVPLFLAATLVGCAHTGARPVAPTMAPFGDLREGSVAAVGLLDFLNDQGHELELLDRSIGLDRRASEAIVAHRAGADGHLGTDDDGWFTSLAELDAVSWVGPASMSKLAGWASAHGYMSTQHRVVGNFEGVSFTFDQAERTLELVNNVSPRALDVQLHIDARAVSSIVAARPVQSLGQLSELYWVGPATLTRLRTHADTRTVASR
jgi:hypothetical protein